MERNYFEKIKCRGMKKLRKKQFSISWIVKTTKGFRIIELEDYEDQEYKSRVGPSEQKRC